jgi:glucuronoarabinoxylan endo-1,4-beta-xylanase
MERNNKKDKEESQVKDKNPNPLFVRYLLPVFIVILVFGAIMLPRINAASATVTINTATTYQTLDGFGAACAWYGEWLTGNSNKSAIYDLLFKNNLDFIRFRNTYGSGREGGVFCPYEAELVTQGRTRNSNLKILLCSWSPPSNLKANGTMNGGTLAKVNGAFNYSGFGTYWRDSLVGYQGKGFTPDYISIQNEPDYTNSGWETCQLDTTEGTNASYSKALDAVVSSIASISPKPKIVGPEVTGIGSSKVQNYMASLNQSNINVVGHHLYNGGDANSPDSFNSIFQTLYSAYSSKPRWQTEYDQGGALNTAILMYNSLVYEQVTAYFFWDLVWANNDLCLVNLPSQNASTYTVTDYYYVVKQFAGWTDPGYKRVAASSTNTGVRATAFVNGNSLSVILINTSGSEASVTLSLNTGVSSSTVYVTTPGGSNKCTNKGALGSGNTVTVPNNSIATVAITTGTVVTTPTPVTQTPTPVRTATPRQGTTPTPTPARTPTPRTVTTPTPVPGAGYVVTYGISDFGTGATINVTIKNNTSTAVNGWTLAWTFPSNQTITNMWNATYTQSGASVSAKNMSYNNVIAANGGTQSFGFNINYSGTNAKPASFTLNGTPCTVQ